MDAVRVVDRVADMADWDQPSFADGTMAAWDVASQKFVGRSVSVPVVSVFGRTGAVAAESADYADFYALLAGGNTFTGGPQVFLGGATFRQSGGTAGVNEIRVTHTGTLGLVQSMTGATRVAGPDGNVYLSIGTGSARFGGEVGDVGETRFKIASGGLTLGGGFPLRWTVGATWDTGTAGLVAAAAKVVEINNATPGGAGGTLRSIPLTPAQVTSDQNNYAPGVARHYRLSTDATRTITGLAVGHVDGQECRVWNVGGNDIVIAHQSASSTAANRFACHTGADITAHPGESLGLVYDAATARWRTHP